MYINQSALIRADLDGNIADWDAGAEKFFGYLREEALGQSLDLIVPEECRERHWEGLNRAVATGVCHLGWATTNVPIRCKDGRIQPFPAPFVFLQNARGGVAGVMSVYAARTGHEVLFGQIEVDESPG